MMRIALETALSTASPYDVGMESMLPLISWKIINWRNQSTSGQALLDPAAVITNSAQASCPCAFGGFFLQRNLTTINDIDAARVKHANVRWG